MKIYITINLKLAKTYLSAQLYKKDAKVKLNHEHINGGEAKTPRFLDIENIEGGSN